MKGQTHIWGSVSSLASGTETFCTQKHIGLLNAFCVCVFVRETNGKRFSIESYCLHCPSVFIIYHKVVIIVFIFNVVFQIIHILLINFNLLLQK